MGGFRPSHINMPVVWIAPDVLSGILAEATRKFPLETGGVLLGYADLLSSQVAVCAWAGPGPQASHRRTGFVPDHEYHERETARIYAESGRIWAYLGDWHSHPRGALELSRTDRRTVARIARSPGARVPRPIMIVLAGVPTTAALGRAPNGRGAALTSSGRKGAISDAWPVRAWQLLDRPSRWDATVGCAKPVVACVRILPGND